VKSNSFWQTLSKPIIGLAPMDGVTDQAFRQIIKKYGGPDIVYTEFSSVEGICHGAKTLLKDFIYSELERPIIAQVFGITPDFFRQTAVLLCQLGFDGIDINMGCPARNVAHNGAGAALIKTPELAVEIIKATQAGVADWLNGKTVEDCADIKPKIAKVVKARHAQLSPQFQQPRFVPVSVKTRLGFEENIIDEWLPVLLEAKPEAIALHGRTLKQSYGGETDWQAIGQAAQLAQGSGVMILGNGDVKNKDEALEKAKLYNLDGILIGRASFGNPFVFKTSQELAKVPAEQKNMAQIALEHVRNFENISKDLEQAGLIKSVSFFPMRKHLGWYIKGVKEASQIRQQLFQTNNSEEVEKILKKFSLFGKIYS
jgi:nifR3 family TIM-barrel protein